MKYPWKTRPWPHQVQAFKFVLRRMGTHGSAGLQVPMRWGKTKLGVDVASALAMKYGVRRVLVVTTVSGMAVWEKEILKHSPLPVQIVDRKGVGLYGVTGDEDPVRWMITHHMALFDQVYDRDDEGKVLSKDWVPGPSRAIEEFDPELIEIDEAHRIGEAGSEVSKLAYKYGKQARFRLTMTGTAFHRGPLAVFGQMRFLDDSLFGTTVAAFRRQFVRFGGYGNYEIVGYQNLEQMAKKLKEALFIQEKPPMARPPVIATTPVILEESRPYYREMEKESAIQVGGRTITAPIVLTRHLRAQQIAGGWVRDPDGGGYLRVGSEKRRVLEDKLLGYQEEGIEKVVIACRFVPEIRDIAAAAGSAGYRFVTIHGNVPAEERAARVTRFQDTDEPIVFIGQVQAASEAIELSEADVLVWYSMPESYLMYDQMNARIEKYMDKRTLFYDHLIARGTRDEVTWMAMQLKQDVARFLVTHPKVVERITDRGDVFNAKA